MDLKNFRWIFALGFGLTACSGKDTISLPIKLNCGGADHKDWVSDQPYVDGGRPHRFEGSHQTKGIENTAPARVYETVRHGDHRYEIAVPNGKYRVRFHFTDVFEDKGRTMNYFVNGQQVIDGFNPYQTTEKVRHAVVMDAIVASKNGKLEIEVKKGKGNDVFQAGIEIARAGFFDRLTKSRINQFRMRPSKPSENRSRCKFLRRPRCAN